MIVKDIKFDASILCAYLCRILGVDGLHIILSWMFHPQLTWNIQHIYVILRFVSFNRVFFSKTVLLPINKLYCAIIEAVIKYTTSNTQGRVLFVLPPTYQWQRVMNMKLWVGRDGILPPTKLCCAIEGDERHQIRHNL